MTPDQRQLDRVRARAAAQLSTVVETTIQICETPAPTGSERERAEVVASLLRQRGLIPEIDDIGNVYARRGNRGGPVLMFAAHTDTVFPAGTDVTVIREQDRIKGPGVGDNSLGVAAMIGVLDVLDDLDITTDVDIVAVANVGEEGLGNLRGIRAAVDRYRGQLGAVVAVEGHNLGRVTHAAVGSVRWRVVVRGPGGHSWGAFGKPSAIHGLGRIIAQIADLEVPVDPRTTYNVGIIEGGTSVNTIAPEALAVIDMRSVNADELDRLAGRVGGIVADYAGEGLETDVVVLGERPAGSITPDHPLVAMAGDILRSLGHEPTLDASSTDANVPISEGIPAICVGISYGGGGHTVSEFIEVNPIVDGLTQLALLCIRATAWIAGAQKA